MLQNKKSVAKQPSVIIVSGLPRSGTSLMMQIMQAAGVSLLIDKHRPADENNPLGYFEYDAVKKLPENSEWLRKAGDKAVKIISHLLFYLPDDLEYKIIFMRRNLKEVVQSQNEMLERTGKPAGKLSDAELRRRFQNHLKEVGSWLAGKDNIITLDMDYANLINNSDDQITKLSEFLELAFPPGMMKTVIRNKLYRTRTIE